MAYNEKLAQRVRMILAKRKGIAEKKMFGGLSFLLNGKMLCGVLKEDLVLRVDQNQYEEVLNKPHTRPMNFTGRPMKGFVYVNSKGYRTDKTLAQWIQLTVDYVTSLSPKKSKAKK